MVLYKFKKPNQAEDKPKTEPRKTLDSKDSEDSVYHYDYMKQLMKQKNGTKSTKATEESKKSKNGPFCLTKYDLQPFVEVSVLLVVIICIMFVAVFYYQSPIIQIRILHKQNKQQPSNRIPM